MVENYQREILSPIQIRKKPYDINGQNHPARDEIKNCVGNFNLSISVEEDLETLKLFAGRGPMKDQRTHTLKSTEIYKNKGNHHDQ